MAPSPAQLQDPTTEEGESADRVSPIPSPKPVKSGIADRRTNFATNKLPPVSSIRERAASMSNVGEKPGRGPGRRISQRPPNAFSERRRTSILVGQRSVDFFQATHPEGDAPRFVTFIIKLYKRWAYFIVDHDWKAILICTIISLLAIVKINLTPQINDITGYSPYGARARVEHTRYQEFFSKDGLGIAIYIFALAKDGGTMLRTSHLQEVVDILDFTGSNFTIFNEGKNKSQAFNEFCNSFCSINEPVRQFYNGFSVQSDLAKKGLPLNGRIVLQYPMSSIFSRQFSMQNNFYGIELLNATQQAEPDFARLNETNNQDLAVTPEELAQHVTNMKEVKMVVLQFRAEHQDGWNEFAIKDYEMAVVEYFKDVYKSDQLDLYVLDQTHIENEMVRAGISLVPYLSVGFLIMCACAIVSVVLRALYMHQHSLPKILLAVAACILPFFSCATALALMFLCGIRFASILCVIPFLVLAIGVDSSYLMIHEWQRVIQSCREQPNRRNMQIGYRIAELLSEVGPAILISALTNILADAVGSFTSSPEITLLCVGNMTSMFVAFIYQMTFYIGLMSLIGRYEIKVEREERNKAEISLRDRQVHISSINNNHNALTRQHSKFHEETKEYISRTMWAYVSFIANKLVASLIIITYFAYLIISIWGITRININLSTQKLFAADSPLLKLDQLRVKYQVPHFFMATVFVNNPGNFSDVRHLKVMNKFVEDMESINGSWGPVGTKYFVRDFLQFQNSFEDADFEEEDLVPADEEHAAETEETNTNSSSNTEAANSLFNSEAWKKENDLAGLYSDSDLDTFVAWPEYSYWGGFIRLDNQSSKLEKFFFTTAYHGQDLPIWTRRAEMLNRWRQTVDEYTDLFDASLFHEDAIFLDLIENMPTDTWQSVLGAVVCMAVVCYIFLNSWFAVTIATTAVLSICTGILGLISWWNIDLDPISMAAMIICIGSSCDLPAHTAFHYYLATVRGGADSSPQIKLANCLSTIAFPAIQAAVSMILCVCSLLFVQLYMSYVFVKTMILCVLLCNIHALIFIPAFLVMWDYVSVGVKTAYRSKKSGGTDKVTPAAQSNNDAENNGPRNAVAYKLPVAMTQSLPPVTSDQPLTNISPTPSPLPTTIESKDLAPKAT